MFRKYIVLALSLLFVTGQSFPARQQFKRAVGVGSKMIGISMAAGGFSGLSGGLYAGSNINKYSDLLDRVISLGSGVSIAASPIVFSPVGAISSEAFLCTAYAGYFAGLRLGEMAAQAVENSAKKETLA